jgi:DeoR/GlpR family transcriptional regulator of sugar metabolism
MNNRQQEILSILFDHNFTSVGYLSGYFNVSEMTIRRDLRTLEETNAVRRVHGGVVPLTDYEREPIFDQRAAIRVDEKQIIARLAAELVADNSVIALDTGSSALTLVRRLTAKKNLTIITSNIHIIRVCLNHPNLTVIVPGGILRPYEGSLVGPTTIESLSSCHVDQFFMGIGGIDLFAGVTEYSMEDIAVKRIITANARQIIALADSSKFGKVTLGSICSLEKLNMVVTNQKVPDDYQRTFDRLKVSVICP